MTVSCIYVPLKTPKTKFEVIPPKHVEGDTFPVKTSLSQQIFLVKPGFHMIVCDRSRSLGSLVNCSAIVKPSFHMIVDDRYDR